MQDSYYEEEYEREKPLPLYAFLFGSALTMLFRISTYGMTEFWLNCLVSFLVGVLCASGYAMLEPTLALLISAYQEGTRNSRNRSEAEPTDTSDTDISTENPYTAKSVELTPNVERPTSVPAPIIKDRMLTLPSGTQMRFSEEEEKSMINLLGRAERGDYDPHFPRTAVPDSLMSRMVSLNIVTVDNGTASFTEFGKRLYK